MKLEFVRNNEGVLESVLVISHSHISYEDLRLVCDCGVYTLPNTKIYNNCRVKYEDGKECDWNTFYVIDKGCPNCHRESKKKRTRKTKVFGGYVLEKYGKRIVAISHNCCNRRFEVGQEAVSTGRVFVPKNTRGYVTWIDVPFGEFGTSSDVIHVWFENRGIYRMKFKDIITAREAIDDGGTKATQSQSISL